MSTIGFVGLGNMGAPMAGNLVRAGHAVRGHDALAAARDAAAGSGIAVRDTLADAVRGADVVFCMLPDGDVVLDVLERTAELVARGTLLVDCSTIDIAQARRAHERAASAGLPFLDAPVSGGVGGATAGTLTIMVGGEAQALVAARPALDALAARVVHCGGAGAGQAAKLCNNMLLATTMIGAGESFSLGRKLGLDPAVLFDILSTSSGSCWSVNRYCPVPGVGPRSPADDGFRPGFSARMMLKDAALTQSAADAAGQATPLGARALELYREFVETGGGERDFSAIIEHLDGRRRE